MSYTTSIPTLNPSRYRLPQHTAPDRQRARAATVALERDTYQFASDAGPGNPSTSFHLPAGVASLPKAEKFGPEKLGRFLIHKAFAMAQAPFIRVSLKGSPMDNQADYERAVGWLPRPRQADHWYSDEDFARQRLTGVNPKALFRWTETPPDTLARASEGVLQERYGVRLNTALDQGRLYGTDFSVLQDARIQAQVRPGTTLAAPTSLFYVDDHGTLMPISILLRPESASEHPAVCVDDTPGNWMMARMHAQCANAHVHETVYHLLETHMVSEVFAMCTARNLHPDHPIHQLLGPHFEWNLAINHIARADLLSEGGPIDTVFCGSVGGGLDAARIVWGDWSFERRSFYEDLRDRGVQDQTLREYYYRDDASEIYDALEDYVRRIVRLWYLDDRDIERDYELQAWASEASTHIPHGFESKIGTCNQLVKIATEVIFRASAGHSSVNNGQFDSYSFVPNCPGSLTAGLPGVNDFSETDVFDALPGTERSVAATSMSWILSQPTHRSILATGESPAFERELNPEAHAAVDALRSRLQRVSAGIRTRNREIAVPYTYLDPANVARSTGI